MKHANRINQVILGIVFFVFLFLSLPTYAQADTVAVEVEIGTIAENELGQLSIFLTPSNTSNELSVITTEIAYDDGLVEVLGCDLLGFNGVCNTDTAGLVKLSAVHVVGIGVRTAVATLSINPLGQEGDRVDFIPTTILVASAVGNSIPDYTDINGHVTINEPASSTAVSINNSDASETTSIYLLMPLVLLILLIAFFVFAKRVRKQ